MQNSNNSTKKVPVYKAIGDAILIKMLKDDGENITHSGLKLPDTMREEEHFGIVHDIGPDCLVNGIEVGDKVVFSPHLPAGWKNGAGDRFLKMRPQDIWSVVTYQDNVDLSI